MTNKHWIWVVTTFLCFVLLIVLPLQKMYEQLGLSNYSRMASSLTRTLFILLPVIFISKKFRFFENLGMIGRNSKNIAVLLFPLVYPGMLGYSKLGNPCPEHFALPMVISTIAAAMNEEIIFRGFMQGYLIKKTNLSYHRIFLITSFFFAIGHFLSLRRLEFFSVLNQVLFAYCIGLLFSAIQLRVNNIWLVGLVHAAINLILGSCSNASTTAGETTAGILDIILAIGSALLIFSPTIFFYWILMKGMKRNSKLPETPNNV